VPALLKSIEGLSKDKRRQKVKSQNKIRIFPGAWRPHAPWEHIAWIGPPWDTDDYVWLDFPEAIFTDQGLLYLSHESALFPTVFTGLPAIEWTRIGPEISYRRNLPNGVSFSGSLCAVDEGTVKLWLAVDNGSIQPLTTIRLQTCLFLRAHYQLSAYTLTNKYVHTSSLGWLNLEAAKKLPDASGPYRLGWRDGPKVADLPVGVCMTSSGDRAVAMSWFEDTYSLISNPDHPCIHADPAIPDLDPGDRYVLQGEIYFARNGLEEIERRYAG
jgi:hypothetical protein